MWVVLLGLLLSFCCVLRVDAAYDSDFIIPVEHACQWPVFERFHFNRWRNLVTSRRFPKITSNTTIAAQLNSTIPDKVPKLLLLMLGFFEEAPTALTSLVTRAHHMLHVLGYIAHIFERTHRFDNALVDAILKASQNGTLVGSDVFQLGHNFIFTLPARRLRSRSLQCLEVVITGSGGTESPYLLETLAWLVSLAPGFKTSTTLADVIDKEFEIILTYLLEMIHIPSVSSVHRQVQTCQSQWLRDRMDSIPEE